MAGGMQVLQDNYYSDIPELNLLGRSVALLHVSYVAGGLGNMEYRHSHRGFRA